MVESCVEPAISREREDDHDHRRFRQRGNHHLSTRADTAEAGTDIEPG